jgi:hypothetical protein
VADYSITAQYPKRECSSKVKMSALSKVEMSVSALFGSSEAVISMGMVMMSKREPTTDYPSEHNNVVT